MEDLVKLLVQEIGADSKYWRKLISKNSELRKLEEGQEIWEAKKKHIDGMAKYIDGDRLRWVRDVRSKHRKLVELFSRIIADIKEKTAT